MQEGMTKVAKLQMLADHLKGVEDTLFDLTNWIKIGECGAVCCAFGHAASIPAFKKLGLETVLDSSERDEIGYIRFGNKHGYDAASKFFEIDYKDAHWLFNPDYYHDKSRKSVIERIEKFLTF